MPTAQPAVDDFDTGVALPTYTEETQGDGLLRIQWRNGEPKLETPGRFFVSEENLGDLVPGAPWVKTREVFDDGTKSQGYKAEALDMAILCVRAQPFHWSAANGTPGRYKIWQGRWVKGDAAPEFQSMSVEVLAYVQGFTEPVVWTSATIKTSFAIIAQRGDSILRHIDQAMVKAANQTAKRPLDRYAFWAGISTERDAKGEVVYTPTKGKAVTLPVLALPPEKQRDRAWLLSRFVGGTPEGKTLLAYTLIPLREQYEGWRQERRSNEAEAPPVAAPTGRNVPQPVGADEFGIGDVI